MMNIIWCLERNERFILHPDNPDIPSFCRRYFPEIYVEIFQDTKKLLLELLSIPEDERYVYEEEDF